MILDSNIIIYSVQPENSRLRQFIAEQSPVVSALSYLEVLGYHQLTADDRLYFHEFFDATRIIPISQAVIEQAVILRQQRRMSVGDAIIARTAHAKLIRDNGYPLLGVGFVGCFHFKYSHQVLGDRL